MSVGRLETGAMGYRAFGLFDSGSDHCGECALATSTGLARSVR
jgi:hypothetical protein